MAKRWPPILGVVGFDGGAKAAIALATVPQPQLPIPEVPAAPSCNVTLPATFHITYLAQHTGDPDQTRTRDYTPTSIYNCDADNCLYGVCSLPLPWLQSFSGAWCSYWFCGPGPCVPADHCGPNDDTGDWCELDCAFAFNYGGLGQNFYWGFTTTEMDAWLRFGTVNGNTGWHVLLQFIGDPPFSNTGWFNVFLGASLNGTVTTTLGPYTWTWTIFSP
jgi:hypothetical protein